jgi:phosphoribosylglycinamide formyltransferase-1
LKKNWIPDQVRIDKRAIYAVLTIVIQSESGNPTQPEGPKLNKKIQIGVLISGGGSNLQAIIDACNNGRINGQIVFAGADTPGAGGLDRARRNDIATFVVDYKSIIREFNKVPHKALLPDDFDLDEIVAKQTLFSDQEDPQKVRSFLMIRAIAEAKLLEGRFHAQFNTLFH